MPLYTQSSCNTMTIFNRDVHPTIGNTWVNTNIFGSYVYDNDGNKYRLNGEKMWYHIFNNMLCFTTNSITWVYSDGSWYIDDKISGLVDEGYNVWEYNGKLYFTSIMYSSYRYNQTTDEWETTPWQISFEGRNTWKTKSYIGGDFDRLKVSIDTDLHYTYIENGDYWEPDVYLNMKVNGLNVFWCVDSVYYSTQNGEYYKYDIDNGSFASTNAWNSGEYLPAYRIGALTRDDYLYYLSQGENNYNHIYKSSYTYNPFNFSFVEYTGFSNTNGLNIANTFLYNGDIYIANWAGVRKLEYVSPTTEFSFTATAQANCYINSTIPETVEPDSIVELVFKANQNYHFTSTYQETTNPTQIIQGCDFNWNVSSDFKTLTLTCSNFVDNTRIFISAYPDAVTEYTLTVDTVNCAIASSAPPTTITASDIVDIGFKQNDGFKFTENSITLSGATLRESAIQSPFLLMSLGDARSNVHLTVKAFGEAKTYSITYELENCYGVNLPTNVTNVSGETYTLQFVKNNNTVFRDAPTAKNADVLDYYYADTDSMYVTIGNITGDVVVSVKASSYSYSIKYNLINCYGSEQNPNNIDISSPTTAFRFYPNVNYNLPSTITVTNATIVEWNNDSGLLLLNNFTGDVSIDISSTPITIMSNEVILYQYNGENDVVNKKLNRLGVITGVFRNIASITHLIMEIEYNKLPDFNYVYVKDFNRYYFVSNYSSIVNNMWQLELVVDVLTTYRNVILESSGFVDRNEYYFDAFLNDSKCVIQEGYVVTDTAIDNSVFDNFSNSTEANPRGEPELFFVATFTNSPVV